MAENLTKQVRVRFAPSPTGPFHIGGARTALFNYLFARKEGGSFILRIEDTDKERSKPEFEEDILESLEWLGLFWDEGPRPSVSFRKKEEIPVPSPKSPKNEEQKYIGNFGPYRQSERSAIYKKYIEKLLSEDKAYFCFCSPQELKSTRDYQIATGQPPHYSGKCRSLQKEEVKEKLKKGIPAIVRLKVVSQKIKFKDLIRGDLEFDAGLLGDFPLAKKRGGEYLPLYNFAAAVDDFEMKISHVIRGEDHLSNTPKQILIQKALNFPQPEYAHIPLILGKDKSKLSKRHGAVGVKEYKKEGYLPEALVNFLAFLGWNPGDEREIFSLSSLAKEFSLKRVQKAGAVFNLKKLDYLNGFYIRQKPLKILTELCLPYLIEAGFLQPLRAQKKIIGPENNNLQDITSYKVSETGQEIDFNHLQKIVGLYQERLKKLSEISSLTDFFFKKNLVYKKELLLWKKIGEREIKKNLKRALKVLSKIKEKDWQKDILEKILLQEAERLEDRGELLWPLRVALTGKQASAPPFEIAALLGKEATLARLQDALKKL